MTSSLRCLAATVAVSAFAADEPTQLPEFTVLSPRVANQAPVGTFAMPVSGLRYEPRVDLQGRNLVEGQADVTIRGGIFESTGFRVGTMSLLDPQTGHYLAEIPIAPQMLGAPEIVTGATLARSSTNATSGAIAFGWRPITTRGALQLGAGPHDLWRVDAYQGLTRTLGGKRIGADVSVGHSESDGPVANGDHRFDRVNARVQFASERSQTDVFAGYQAKFFGWPNLYTPFNSAESENLQTLLFAANHRIDFGAGDFVSAGVFYRRNKDDYAFNRRAPVGAVHPFQHTTWLQGAAVEGRRDVGAAIVNVRAEVLSDFLKSTSLTAGRYRSRTLTKFVLAPEKAWSAGEGEEVRLVAGATYDDSNRTGGKVSPLAEVSRTYRSGTLRRLYASYAQATQLPTYTALNSSAASGLFRGNANLGREVSRNLEVGGSGQWAGWSFDAALFGREDHALVDWTFRRGVTARTANAVDVDTAGFEAVARRSWSRIDLVVGYTGLTKDADYRGAAVDASFYALNYARHRLTAAATVRLGHGIELRVDNVARIQADNFLRSIGGDHTVFTTAALAYRPPSHPRIEFTAEVDNLWDSRFQDIPAVPAAPRLWSVGATYVW